MYKVVSGKQPIEKHKIKLNLKRIIKCLLNVAFLSSLIFCINVSYALIVIIENREEVIEMIWCQAERVTLVSIPYIFIITYLNFIFERKLERKKSREFFILSIFYILILILSFAYFSYDFYHEFMLHPEYF